MEQEPIKMELPDAKDFMKNLEERLAKVNDVCLDVISERLGITKEDAKELAVKLQNEAFADYMKEQSQKQFVLLKWDANEITNL